MSEATTPVDAHDDLPPSNWHPPEGASQDDIDRAWLKEVYRGDRMPQLTFRALAVGVCIGAFMSLSNLYVGLKTGWGLGASITAVVLAFAFFNVIQKVIGGDHFNVLENNTMQTTASAAAYMSSAGLVSAVPALYMTTGTILTGWQLTLWMLAICMLGVMIAVPVKRQLINKEQLTFPEGIACAETLRSMHSKGKEAIEQAKALGVGGLVGVVVTLIRDLPFLGWIPAQIAFPGSIKGIALSALTIGAEGSTVMFAAGAIIGLRVGVSLLIGGLLSYAVAGPWLATEGIIESASYRNIVSWTLWPGVMFMLTYSIAGLAMQWRMIARALGGLLAVFSKGDKEEGVLDHIEIPNSWFIVGLILAGIACVILQVIFFDIVWWTAILAVALTFLLCVVAARATGETSITPVGPLGKLTQLMFGVLAPANMTANLMAANVTAGASSQVADLMNDLKTGYLVGGSPRRQFKAQLVGVLFGAFFATPAYEIFVVKRLEKNPDLLGSVEMPAPAAQVWAKVAELLAKGLDSIPQSAQTAMLVFGILGVVLALVEGLMPQLRKYLPSVMGMGIAACIPFYNSFSMFLGALAIFFLAKVRPDLDKKFTIVVSSGLIAGETLAAVFVIMADIL